MLKKPNQEAIKEEQKIQQDIYSCIDEFKSFVFYAGAGAGKTYALKESLRYLLKNRQKELNRKNQKIICITYTNVAVNEIKRRIGNSDLVLVSTIHERMWDVIKNYPKELILIHKEKLENETKYLQEKIMSDNFFNDYPNKDNLKEEILKNQDKLKKMQSLKAKEYKENVKNLIGITFPNAQKFKDLVNYLIKVSKFKNAIEDINSKKTKKVKYDMFYNFDRLEKMKFSHDTLLEYTYKMIQKYSNLQRILVDKNSYIFVDEFQDTNRYVVDSFNLLINYAKENNKKFLVGYFGDAYQKIYTDGIGKKIIDEKYLKEINKKFNRRSLIEIIDLINKVRDDDLKQKTIYNNASGGKIELQFGNGDFASIQKYIDNICKNNNIDKKNKLHILFLTNKLIAKFGGFEEFYNFFSNFIYYNELNTQLMSKDTTKLHKSVDYIYNFIDLYKKIISRDVLSSLVDKKDIKDILLKKYKSDIFEINQKLNKITRFIDLFNVFIDISKDNNNLMRFLHNKYIRYNNLDELKTFFIESLNIEEEKYEKLDEFLNLEIQIFINWYIYIISNNKDNMEDKIIYHTYHSTKGEEYNNVLVVMDNDFGKKNKNVIKNFFIDKSNSNETIINLLYVSFSRAKKNLFIYYINNDLNDKEKKTIEQFFKATK